MSSDIDTTPSQSLPILHSSDNDASNIQVVEFLLGNEPFAIDLFEVREVVEYSSITPLPNTPDYITGIIDLRGEITSIINLKQRLNIKENSQSSMDLSRIIVLDDNVTMKKVGILVDDVTSVSVFEKNQVDYTSASFIKEESAIIGIIKRPVLDKDKHKNDLIIWIDIKKLLQDINY